MWTVKWHTSPLSDFPNPWSLLLSSLGTASSADIFLGGGLGHCSCNVLVSDWWLCLALKCSDITYLGFRAKISSCLSPILSSCCIQSLSLLCCFFFGKLTYFFLFSFPSWNEDSWVIVGWNISFELHILTLVLLILRHYQANMDEWNGNPGVNVFWDLSLLWLLHSNILVSYGFFLCSSLKEWGRHFE